MHPSATKVAAAAQALGLALQIVEFPVSTRTAADAAAAIGCTVGQIVKSLLFTAREQPIMALVSGANRLDEAALAQALGVSRSEIQRPDAAGVRAITGFVIGGVPPFGHPTSLPTVMDADLLTYDVVWAAAGTPQAVFAIAPTQLAQITQAQVAPLKQR